MPATFWRDPCAGESESHEAFRRTWMQTGDGNEMQRDKLPGQPAADESRPDNLPPAGRARGTGAGRYRHAAMALGNGNSDESWRHLQRLLSSSVYSLRVTPTSASTSSSTRLLSS